MAVLLNARRVAALHDVDTQGPRQLAAQPHRLYIGQSLGDPGRRIVLIQQKEIIPLRDAAGGQNRLTGVAVIAADRDGIHLEKQHQRSHDGGTDQHEAQQPIEEGNPSPPAPSVSSAASGHKCSPFIVPPDGCRHPAAPAPPSGLHILIECAPRR